jgi:transposase-like protein
MGKGIRKPAATPDIERVSLSELIHEHVRVAIETAVHEELHVALGARSHERHEARRGYRNGMKTRTLTGPSGPLARSVPRARLFGGGSGPRRCCPGISGGCPR